MCGLCAHVSEEADLLKAPSPFDPLDDLVGCPACKSVGDFDLLCDEPSGCKRPASSGTPTPDGYRRTCYEHSPRRS